MARVSFSMTPQVFYYLLIMYIKGDVRDKNASNIETVYVKYVQFFVWCTNVVYTLFFIWLTV